MYVLNIKYKIMTAKELAKELLKNPEFQVKASIFEKDNSSWGATLQSFKIDGVNDIGYSNKNIILGLTRED